MVCGGDNESHGGDKVIDCGDKTDQDGDNDGYIQKSVLEVEKFSTSRTLIVSTLISSSKDDSAYFL